MKPQIREAQRLEDLIVRRAKASTPKAKPERRVKPKMTINQFNKFALSSAKLEKKEG